MSQLQTKLQTDVWIVATWDEYIQTISDLVDASLKGYYYKEQMRLEMLPVGSDHSTDHLLIAFAINLFAMLKGIAVVGRDNCSYRKTGKQEYQPDLSYYLGDQAQSIPRGTTVVDLDRYPVPALVVEIASTSLLDDTGTKRLLYEDLGVDEYWVVDVQTAQILAFAVANRGSWRIDISQVLPGLEISVLEEALKLSRQWDQSQVGNWLLQQFQQ